MKIIEKWNEVDRRQAGAGMQVLYELGGYRIAVSDASYMPGGLSITAYPINRDSYSPEIYVGASYGEAVQRITVQTTSWGALPVSEIDKVIGAYTEAQMVAREIYLAFPECFKAMEDEPFADLMDTFLRCMAHARRDGGLYCDGVVSKEA